MKLDNKRQPEPDLQVQCTSLDFCYKDVSRIPVTTKAESETLDIEDVIIGYWAGRRNLPCSGSWSRSFWHGWRNGRVDGGHAASDGYQQQLAHDVVVNSRGEK